MNLLQLFESQEKPPNTKINLRTLGSSSRKTTRRDKKRQEWRGEVPLNSSAHFLFFVIRLRGDFKVGVKRGMIRGFLLSQSSQGQKWFCRDTTIDWRTKGLQ